MVSKPHVSDTAPKRPSRTAESHALPLDVQRYLEMARRTGGPILELCGELGCVAIPLARAGYRVVTVDISKGALKRLQANLDRESREVGQRVYVLPDMARLKLEESAFPLAVMASNALLDIANFDERQEVLDAIARHLVPGGVLVLDVVNPIALHAAGGPIFRLEIELMLESAGLSLASIEGGHQREPYTARSPQMFVVATKQ
ncbi:class I SAM-dependent methyltransferase [Pendulispora albinea]|uniref:Class I SAM-dependent methyltransferase n=1 Tax=Pendulispora albinea TaxID=2741071 RepID=A0ABZ2LW73_9BACT